MATELNKKTSSLAKVGSKWYALACELKGMYAIDADEDRKIANRVAAFDKELGGKKTIHVTMVTTNGLAHNVLEQRAVRGDA